MKKGWSLYDDNNITSKPFYFAAVFWGEEYKRFFIDLALASLLSPNNIPALSNKKDSRFIIATTEENWQAIQDEPLYILLKTYIDVIYINLINSSEGMHKMRMMSYGHKMVSEAFFQNKAVGVFLTPDLVLSDGSIISLEKRISEGKKVVLCAAIRFEYHGCMQGLTDLGALRTNQPLVISSRQLMSVVLNHLHSESKTWLWDEPYYAFSPVCTMWKLPGQSNYVLHSYTWAPIAVDYSTIQNHDTTTFENSTLDQDYVFRNFGISDDIYVVTDSDEVALASFTDENDLSIPLIPHPAYSVPGLKNILNKDKLRRFHHCPIHGMDPLKQKLVLKSVFFHGEAIDPSSDKIIRKARRLIHSSIKRKPIGKEYIVSLISQLNYFHEIRMQKKGDHNKEKRNNLISQTDNRRKKKISTIKRSSIFRIIRNRIKYVKNYMERITSHIKTYMKYIKLYSGKGVNNLKSLSCRINRSNIYPLTYFYLFLLVKNFKVRRIEK